jgi:hypothetical protein
MMYVIWFKRKKETAKSMAVAPNRVQWPAFQRHSPKMALSIEELLAAHHEDEFRALTGLAPSTFRIIWDKYCGPETPIPKPAYLFALFKFYKLYPVWRAWRTFHTGLRSMRSFIARLRKWEVIPSQIDSKLGFYPQNARLFDAH